MPQDNRLLIVLGALAAVVAAVVIALVVGGGRDRSDAPPPAAQGGLTVALADAPEIDQTRQLRCFVDGRFVGMATLADCARQNGLATDALDVGVDSSGALVAAPTASLTPAPEAPPVELTQVEPDPLTVEPLQPSAPAVQPTGGAACLRHTGAEWRTVSTGVSLNACVQALYSGTCVRPGEAQYGRHGETTLRLVPRRVEQSPDNRRFRTLVEQDRNCQFPGIRG